MRRAFTLSEVLITLGIIGIVSTLTIPALTQNWQKKAYVGQVHEFYSTMQRAIDGYISENQATNFKETPLYNNETNLTNFFDTNFKIVKKCGKNFAPCFADSYKTISGTSSSTSSSKCVLSVTLANGVSVCTTDRLDRVSEGDEVPDILRMEFDVNGLDGPNIYGRDYFRFEVNENGVIHDSTYDNNGSVRNSDKFGFFGKIQADGWQMNY